MNNNKIYWYLVAPGALFLIIFLIFPLVSIIVFSFWKTQSYTLIAQWNIENYIILLTEKTYLTFIMRSLLMATFVSLVSLMFAWPVAFYIARYGGKFKLIYLLLTSAPFLTGEILRVTAIQQILGPIGLINMFLSNIGIEPIDALMYSNVASAIGLIYLWLPFMVLAIYLSLLNFLWYYILTILKDGAYFGELLC